MNGVFVSCLPVSVFSSYFMGNPSEEKRSEWEQYLVSNLSAIKDELLVSSEAGLDTLFSTLMGHFNLWQNEDYIFPFIRANWDGSVVFLWRVNGVCLEIAYSELSVYDVTLYNVKDILNGVKPEVLNYNRMVTVIENFFETSSLVLRDNGINWRSYLNVI